MSYEISPKGKPSEIRLYTLRKFFRKYANQMGFEHVNHLMGHTTKGSDSNYTPKDDEFYRDLYEKYALPYLEIESPTPADTYKLKQEYQKELEKRDNEIQKLQKQIDRIEKAIRDEPPKIHKGTPDWVAIGKRLDELDEWEEKHPEEAKIAIESQYQYAEERKELEKFAKEHPKEAAKLLQYYKYNDETIKYILQTKKENKTTEE
jgi:hypothetical protein